MGCVSSQPQSRTKKQLNTSSTGLKVAINPDQQTSLLQKQPNKQNTKVQQNVISAEKQNSTIKLQKILSQQQKKSPNISPLKAQLKQSPFHTFQNQIQQPAPKTNLSAIKDQSQLKAVQKAQPKIKLNLDQIDQRSKQSQITKKISQSNPSNLKGLSDLGMGKSLNGILEAQDHNKSKSNLSRISQNPNNTSKVYPSKISDKKAQILRESQIRVDISGEDINKHKQNIRNTETLQQVNQEDYTILHQQSLQIGGGFDPRALVIDMNKVAW